MSIGSTVQAKIVTQNFTVASHRRPFARVSFFTIACACIAAVIFDGAFTRPIWLDEFGHFAFGSVHSTGEALDLIAATITGLNRGATGVYILLDYWLLHIFGASAVALRMPSLLSALLLFGGSAAVLRARGFGLGWQLFAIIALVGHETLMYFVGEARPYMPLAAATMGTVAYYLFAPEERARLPVEALGALSIITGVLMHPYFSVYWLVLFVFAHCVLVSEKTILPGWRSLLRHVNVPLCVVGAAIYFIVAALTWLRGGPSYAMDPFEYIKSNAFLRSVILTHVQFVAEDLAKIVFMLGAITAFGSVVAFGAYRTLFRALLPPVILFILALLLSALVSYISYREHYWVLNRQWVASLGLADVAVVWFWADFYRCAAKFDRRAGWIALAVAIVIIVRLPLRQHEIYEMRARDVNRYFFGAPQRMEAETELPDMTRAPSDRDGWVALANRNIQMGGSVWPIFRQYFDPTAWGAPFRGGRLD